MNLSLSAITRFIGHLHVVFVHLPIGFIILLGALEAAALLPRYKHVIACSRLALVLSVLAAAVTIGCGWLMSFSGGYDGDLLFWHKWLGTGVGIAALLLLFLHWRGWLKTYRVGLFATLILLTVAGHFGGSLTHGSDFLKFPTVADKPKPAAPVVPNGPVYANFIQPIFDQNCIGCHGPHKSKGKLRLDSAENLFTGGDSGPVLVPGDPAGSLLLKRLHLPSDDDDHMPPDGKLQPSADQISLLQWWIYSGASTTKTARDLNPPENIQSLLQTNATASASL